MPIQNFKDVSAAMHITGGSKKPTQYKVGVGKGRTKATVEGSSITGIRNLVVRTNTPANTKGTWGVGVNVGTGRNKGTGTVNINRTYNEARIGVDIGRRRSHVTGKNETVAGLQAKWRF